MTDEKYRVTCRNCKGSDIIRFVNQGNQTHVFYTNHVPIIAARYRPDLKWGFECGNCGNDSRLAYEERNNLKVLVRGASESALEAIAKNLKRKNEDNFSMEPVNA